MSDIITLAKLVMLGFCAFGAMLMFCDAFKLWCNKRHTHVKLGTLKDIRRRDGKRGDQP